MGGVSTRSAVGNVGSRLACCLAAALVLPGNALAQAEPASQLRVAVLVGANGAAPGRQALQFGHRDAERMAQVLRDVGGFAPEDLILLKDPAPAELVAAVEGAVARLAGKSESLFYFYYSGHADERSLFPAGRAVPLKRLRELIDGAHVAVKVGVVDACRGGSWTRAKGMTAEKPFEVRAPVSLGSEGSVLIASSSGLENAHESDQLQGSFFTFHFVAGLRGAADRNDNGQVTVNEAFEYAREQTIRDSIRQTLEVQNPSFGMNLHGRRELVLAQIDASPTRLDVQQTAGPLQIIQAETGLQLLELAAGRRHVQLAVPPGHYLVRKPGLVGNLVKEITVRPGVSELISEDDLVLVGTPQLATKAADLIDAPVELPPLYGAGSAGPSRGTTPAPAGPAPPVTVAARAPVPPMVSKAAVPPHRWILLPALGTGLGWGRGQPEVNQNHYDPQAMTTQPYRAGGVNRAALLHLAPELGYFVAPRLLVSAQLRLQIVKGATKVPYATCTQGLCEPPSGSVALLARGSWLADVAPRLRALLSVAAGVGTVRHLVDLPEDACGLGSGACVDTIAGGPVLLGPGAALLYQLTATTSLYASLNLLAGIPRAMVNLDGAVGLAIEL
jgi:hypothetical protein